MPNHDRVSEGYKGEVWNAETQKAVRERIHWMCSQAAGPVLDLGCSQGIASIIMAREGLAVTAVDHEISRLRHAQKDLREEEVGVDRRLVLLCSEGRQLPFRDESFQTVLLGEMLEHLVLPHAVLSEVVRVLVPGGRLVATTPLGYHPFHDHKTSFYPASLGDLVGQHLEVESLSIPASQRYVFLTARRSEARGCAAELVVDTQEALERYMLEIERRHDRLWREHRESRQNLATLRRQLAEQEKVAREAVASNAAPVESEPSWVEKAAELEARLVRIEERLARDARPTS